MEYKVLLSLTLRSSLFFLFWSRSEAIHSHSKYTQSFIKAHPQAGHANPCKQQFKEYLWRHNSRPKQQGSPQTASADQTSNVPLWHPSSSVCSLHTFRINPSQIKEHCLLLLEWQREKHVDREDGDGRSAQALHLPFMLGQPGVTDLKRDRGRSQVGRGQAEVSMLKRKVIKGWN